MKKITAVFLTFILAVSLCACSEDSPKSALKARLEALISQANEVSASGTEAEDKTYVLIAKATVKNLKYKISNQTINGHTATVNLKVTTIDMKSLINEAITQYGIQFAANPDFSIDQWIADEINKKDLPTITNESNVPLIKTSESWVIDENGSLEILANSLTREYFFSINGVDGTHSE